MLVSQSGSDSCFFPMQRTMTLTNSSMQPRSGMSRYLLNIEKRSLPRLMLSGDGLASKDTV